jgi:hypothetical protein
MLYRSAKADPGRRFHALRDQAIRSDVPGWPWVAGHRDDGAPGVDKITPAEVEECGGYGINRFFDELVDDGLCSQLSTTLGVHSGRRMRVQGATRRRKPPSSHTESRGRAVDV